MSAVEEFIEHLLSMCAPRSRISMTSWLPTRAAASSSAEVIKISEVA